MLDGKVFSNDAILSRGGRFLQSVESAYPACDNVVASNRSTWDHCLRSGSYYTATGSSATFQVAPAYHENLYLADSSAEFATYPGCHYYGATRIVFHGNGTMTVWSKNSNFSSAVLSIAPPGGTAPDLRRQVRRSPARTARRFRCRTAWSSTPTVPRPW